MNIFILDYDMETSVRYQVDKHVVKMPTETAQLLSTSHRYLDGNACPENLYKLTHQNHPCSKWLRESTDNYKWLYEYFKIQLSEYTFRYGKVHKCSQLLDTLQTPPTNLEIGSMTPHVQCMPDIYKVDDDVVQAYQNYYIGEKQHIAKWKLRDMPGWYLLAP